MHMVTCLCTRFQMSCTLTYVTGHALVFEQLYWALNCGWVLTLLCIYGLPARDQPREVSMIICNTSSLHPLHRSITVSTAYPSGSHPLFDYHQVPQQPRVPRDKLCHRRKYPLHKLPFEAAQLNTQMPVWPLRE